MVDFKFVPKEVAAEIVNKHPATLARYRKENRLIDGIHFVKCGNEYLYNEPLLKDWLANGCDIANADHRNAIEVYQRQKLGNQKRRKAS